MSLPLFLVLHKQEKDQKRIRLWLPLFLVWILILPLLLLLLPFVLLFAFMTWHRGTGRALLLSIPMLIAVVWALPGLHIQVDKPDDTIFIHIA
jgi:hypothetical protein